MTGGQAAVCRESSVAKASGPGHGVRVWGSKGKGAALPLASGALDDERSAVGQSACLRSFPTVPTMLQRCQGGSSDERIYSAACA